MMKNMNIKGIIKKTALGKVKERYNRIQFAKVYSKEYLTQYLDESATNTKGTDSKYLRLRIIIGTHSLEKGLSHKEFKPGFGKGIVKELVSMLKIYSTYTNADKFVIDSAYEILSQYHQKNKQYNFDDSEYLPNSYRIKNSNHTMNAGTKEYDIEKTIECIKKFDFAQFSNQRVSVRMFENKGVEISDDILMKSISIAQNAPNACNRQSVRVHILKKRECFKTVENFQLGCKGFGENVSCFIFITNDLSLYECAEVKLPIFDAGLFTMNLVYALMSEGLLSCVLNASFPAPGAEAEIRKMLNIPENENINGLIAVYKINDVKKIRVPLSQRRNVNEICRIVE